MHSHIKGVYGDIDHDIPYLSLQANSRFDSFNGVFAFVSLFGVQLGENLRNFIEHGNEFDFSKLIVLTQYCGEYGIAHSFSNQGKGFDVQAELELREKREVWIYFYSHTTLNEIYLQEKILKQSLVISIGKGRK